MDHHPKPYKLSWMNKGDEVTIEKRLLVEVGREKIVYALMHRENSATNVDSKLAAEVQQLLMEFSDLMPEDLPPGLPPMRDIQHQIDLILGSSLPNRPVYRRSPKEAEELQRQVVDSTCQGSYARYNGWWTWSSRAGSDWEVPHRDRNIQDVTIEDLHRQVAELTQRLAEQEFSNHDVEGHDFDTSFENPYHHRARVWEHREQNDRHVDLGFRVDLPQFSGT
ncbi:uncharacterized protein LOC111379712 [Olea europaea var. sylvestris]|uniref:uncharacterized protein LOC111379712 n=1 Tax=Olea europaea var. sylvestris TaxID=158386 RepID=UPI000C1D899B|nr:uncharacterized protein LOC111379712 [Olea europaea var. sylvestris]